MKTILVIEDDKILAENLMVFLKREGYSVKLANNGIEGLKIINTIFPDLIICDINMPKMDGFELKEKLNKEKSTFDIPLLFLTARTQISQLRFGMGLGADDYIFKPYNSAELMSIVKLRLDKRIRAIEKYKFSSTVNNESYDENDTFVVKSGKRNKKIEISKIKLIFADGQYSEIVMSNNSKFIMRVSLNDWEAKLPSELFKRAHRSTIINTNFVESRITKENKYFLKINNWKDDIVISRRKLKMFSF